MSGYYDDGLESLLARTIPSTAGVYAVGVNDEYIFDPTHVDFTPITPHIILPEAQLQNVTFTKGFLDADNYKWLAAGAGVVGVSLNLTGVIIYFQEGSVGTLLAYIDSASAGLPNTLTGVNVTARWDARGILKI